MMAAITCACHHRIYRHLKTVSSILLGIHFTFVCMSFARAIMLYYEARKFYVDAKS